MGVWRGDKVGAEEKMWILTLIELQETSMEWISLGSEKSPTGKRLICSFLSNLKQPNIIFVTYLDSVLMKGSFFDKITVGKLRFWSKFGNRYIWIYAFWYLSRTIFQNKFFVFGFYSLLWLCMMTHPILFAINANLLFHVTVSHQW